MAEECTPNGGPREQTASWSLGRSGQGGPDLHGPEMGKVWLE